MLNYDLKDQYHEITLKSSNIKFTGEIVFEENDTITIDVIKTAQSLPITGKLNIDKQDIQSITPAILDNATMYYIVAEIYPNKIEGIPKENRHAIFKISKKEYYKIQVDNNINDYLLNLKIKSYLNKHVAYYGGFSIITQDRYDSEILVSEETDLIEQYGEYVQPILALLSILNIEKRFQTTIANEILMDLDDNKEDLRKLVSRWIGFEG